MMEEQYDQGRSWAVAIAAAAVNLVIGGLARTSGLFFVAFIKDYGVDRKTASFPITVQYCFLFLTGPIVGILGQKYCSSKIILIGGIFGTLSTALCFLPLNIMWITLIWGVFYGISGGLVTFIPQMVITKYFKKHTATASGLGVSGGSIGCFVLPQIFEKFYSECGLEGTFLIMAGVVAHILPAALLLKDPPWTKGKEKMHKSIDDYSVNNERLSKENLNGSLEVNGYRAMPNTQLLQNNNRFVVEIFMAEYRRQSTLRTIVGNDVTGDDVSDALQKLYCGLPKDDTSYTNLGFSECNEEFPRDPEKSSSSKSNGSRVDKLETKNGFVDATDASNFLIYTLLESLLRTNQETLPEDPELSGVLSELNKLYNTRFLIERSPNPFSPKAPEITIESYAKYEAARSERVKPEAPTVPEDVETIANKTKVERSPNPFSPKAPETTIESYAKYEAARSERVKPEAPTVPEDVETIANKTKVERSPNPFSPKAPEITIESYAKYEAARSERVKPEAPTVPEDVETIANKTKVERSPNPFSPKAPETTIESYAKYEAARSERVKPEAPTVPEDVETIANKTKVERSPNPFSPKAPETTIESYAKYEAARSERVKPEAPTVPEDVETIANKTKVERSPNPFSPKAPEITIESYAKYEAARSERVKPEAPTVPEDVETIANNTKVERSFYPFSPKLPEITIEPYGKLEEFRLEREAPTVPEDTETIANITKRALKLYTKPIFASVCITRTYFSITFLSIVTVIVDFAYDKGMGSEEVRYVIMVLAAGDLCGRLCFGWVTDRGYMSMARYLTFVVFTEGVIGVCLPLVNKAETFFLSVAAYGVLQGMLVVTFPVLVAKYMRQEEQVIAFGCMNFYSGIVGIIMPFYIVVKEEYDKGWAWAVAFAAMTINFIVAGLGRVSGIMFIAFMEAYGVDRRAASLPLSVRSSMRNFLGPVVGILGQKYGVRTIILIGGILGTVSTAICFFSTNMLWITVLYGGVGGASAAFVTILPQVVIGQYFKKYKTTAAGMGFSGGCVGSILFPAAVEQMVLSYGIGGTFLVIAAILAHIIPAAIILKDAPWARRQKKTKYKDFELQEVRYPGGGANNSVQTIGNLPSKDSVNRDSDVWPNVQFLRRNNDTVVSMLTTKYPGHAGYSLSLDTECNNSAIVMHTCLSDALEDIYCWLQQSTGRSTAYANFGFSKNNLLHERLQDARHLCSHKYHSFHLSKTDNPGVVSKTNSEPDVATLSNEISSNFVFLKLKTLLRITPSQVAEHFDEETRGEVLTILSELRKLYNMSTRLNNEGVDPPPAPSETETTTTRQDQQSNSLCSHFVTALRLFSKPPFLLLSACRAVHLLTFVPAITTIVDFGIDQGLLEEEGKYIIAALSAGDLIGRLCLGWVTDRGFLSLPKFMLIVMIIQGVNTAGLPFLHDRPLLYSGVFSFGLWQGTLFVRHAVLVSKYCAKNEQSIAMGCSNFFGGFLGLILPMYIGYFRDTLGAYDYMYYLNGVIGASVGLFWALEPIFVRCSGSGELDENEH